MSRGRRWLLLLLMMLGGWSDVLALITPRPWALAVALLSVIFWVSAILLTAASR